MPIRDMNTPMIRKARARIMKKLRTINRAVIEKAEHELKGITNEGVNYYKQTANFTDQTGNLRGSGFSNVEHIETDFDALPEGNKGKKVFPSDKTRPKLLKGQKEHVGVVGVGMGYGVHLQNKRGYDVLMGTKNMLERIFGKRFRIKLSGVAARSFIPQRGR